MSREYECLFLASSQEAEIKAPQTCAANLSIDRSGEAASAPVTATAAFAFSDFDADAFDWDARAESLVPRAFKSFVSPDACLPLCLWADESASCVVWPSRPCIKAEVDVAPAAAEILSTAAAPAAAEISSTDVAPASIQPTVDAKVAVDIKEREPVQKRVRHLRTETTYSLSTSAKRVSAAATAAETRMTSLVSFTKHKARLTNPSKSSCIVLKRKRAKSDASSEDYETDSCEDENESASLPLPRDSNRPRKYRPREPKPPRFAWLHLPTGLAGDDSVVHVPVRLSDKKVGANAAIRFVLRVIKSGIGKLLDRACMVDLERDQTHAKYRVNVCSVCDFGCRGHVASLLTVAQLDQLVEREVKVVLGYGDAAAAESLFRRLGQLKSGLYRL